MPGLRAGRVWGSGGGGGGGGGGGHARVPTDGWRHFAVLTTENSEFTEGMKHKSCGDSWVCTLDTMVKSVVRFCDMPDDGKTSATYVSRMRFSHEQGGML